MVKDPLNWPIWKREALFWTICYTTGLVCVEIYHALMIFHQRLLVTVVQLVHFSLQDTLY